MITFLTGLVLLAVGALIYGRVRGERKGDEAPLTEKRPPWRNTTALTTSP